MKIILAIWMGVLAVTTGFAQETPKVELFGGYSFMHQTFNFNGWNASITGNVNNWLGITGDFSQHFNDQDRLMGRDIIHVHLKDFQYHVGPKFTFRASDNVQPFLYGLIGGARAYGGAGVGPVSGGVTVNALSAAAGGGLDFVVADHVGVRAVQADYNMIHNSFGTGHGIRVSSGVVFRF